MGVKPFKPYPLKKAMKKFHYPFHYHVEPIDPLRGSIQAESDAFTTNIAIWCLRGPCMFIWYACVFGCWCYYVLGYAVYWLVTSNKQESPDSSGDDDGVAT